MIDPVAGVMRLFRCGRQKRWGSQERNPISCASRKSTLGGLHPELPQERRHLTAMVALVVQQVQHHTP